MSDSSDFAELLWENGQAVVHARKRKQPPQQQQAAFPPFTFTCSSSSRAQAQQRQLPVPPLMPKTGGGGLFADFSSAAAGLADAPRDNNADLDDTVPWIHYPIPIVDEASPAAAPAQLADTFIPDFFSELHAAATKTSLGPLPPPPPPVQHTGDHDDDDNRSTPVPNPNPTTGRGPEPSKKSHRAPVVPGPAGRPEPHGPQAELALAPARKPRPESGGGEALMNFSIFSRPAAMARASLRQRPPPHTGTADKASTTSTRVESTVLQSASGSGPRTATAPGPALFVDQRTAWPSQQQPKDVRFPCAAAAPPTTAGNLQQERPSNNNNNSMTPPQKQVETRKASEAAGATATSSVCSGNGAGTTGKDDESWRQQKRKSLQAECSASQDDDPDDESGGMRRSCSRGGAKRSRTAEVHNLSERRRRDRINEKMRALQELIPNCNKIDKASMLDEAIEYLKTLQLQVQMMSMGSGLCIPPMLLPPAMQHHLQIPPAAAHFPHLGMGLGYGGMGVLDMNSAAAVAVPFPHMPGAHFPCPGAPLPRGLGIGMPARNTMPVFGVPPGQPIQPPFPSLAGLPVRPNLAPPHASSAAMANMVQEQQQQQQHQSLNNGASAAAAATASDPQLQTIVQAERQHFSVPSSAQTESDQFLDGGGNRAICTGRNEAET